MQSFRHLLFLFIILLFYIYDSTSDICFLPQQLLKLNDVCLSISSDISITPASSVKNLGVVFDKHLSFHEHIT